jgi:hypothetical protein
MDCYIDPLNPANNLFRPFPSPLVRTSSLRLGPRIPHKRRTKTVALHHMPSKVTSSCLALLISRQSLMCGGPRTSRVFSRNERHAESTRQVRYRREPFPRQPRSPILSPAIELRGAAIQAENNGRNGLRCNILCSVAFEQQRGRRSGFFSRATLTRRPG